MLLSQLYICTFYTQLYSYSTMSPVLHMFPGLLLLIPISPLLSVLPLHMDSPAIIQYVKG